MKNALCIGPDSTRFSRLAGRLDIELCEISCRVFPDREQCIRIHGDLYQKTCYIIQSCDPVQEIHLQQLYQMVEVASFQQAREIICIVPYMAYARQDRRTDYGEPCSANIVLKTLQALGADMFITFDVHNPAIFTNPPLPCYNINTSALFARRIEELDLGREGILISPDKGSYARVKEISGMVALPYHVLAKNKNLQGDTWYEDDRELAEAVAGKKAIIFDDLCSSGSTFIPLARHLLAAGAEDIYYFVTHFFADSEKICRRIGREIVIEGTNTVNNPRGVIDISRLLADWIVQHKEVALCSR